MRLDWLELKVPPLALTVGAAIVMVVVPAAFGRTTSVRPEVAIPIGIAAALAGLLLAFWGVIDFRRAQTTVDPRHPEQSARLVTTGVYRWTRNPMYLGFVAALAGLAIALQSVAGLAIASLAAVYLQRFQIHPEERILQRRFGDAFNVYLGQVRRWL
jgi:protein-S-isoprenylcysteine O-methyltransferase Ste14